MRPLLTLTLALLLAGCGDGNVNKPGTPTPDQIKAYEAAQKQVEEEERGTPITGKKKR